MENNPSAEARAPVVVRECEIVSCVGFHENVRANVCTLRLSTYSRSTYKEFFLSELNTHHQIPLLHLPRRICVRLCPSLQERGEAHREHSDDDTQQAKDERGRHYLLR